MQKKRKPSATMRTLPFWIFWIGWSAITWGIVGIVSSLDAFNDLTLMLQVLIVFSLGGILLSRVQAFLLQRWLGTSLKRWVPVTNLSWIIGSTVIYGLLHYQVGSDQAAQLVFGAIFAVPAITQAWMLRKRLVQTWLWALAGAVSGIVFVIPIVALQFVLEDALWLLLGMGGALVGLIQVLVLDRMLTAHRETTLGKAKFSSESERLALVDRDSSPGWESAASEEWQQNHEDLL